ncbi:type II secretion system F family protein [Phycicoccus sp. BSK3Z-2]|uniref:Type II secretion system F family protein n=1 Tax=Phycicoccus avicenniae TaxID=2828860 RepID=A0A941I0A4_9MICO|nr:type II secretion system F family protein [Phycicoccus avicenniae]MBR7743872.1 type II secretion system F family protein [Phycicoccus avicenniae]
MTGVGIGLAAGIGLFLVWWSCWVPDPPRPRAARNAGPLDRLSDEVVQAGFAGLTLRGLLVMSVVAFGLVLAIGWLTIGVLPVAVCFAAIASAVPVVVVRRRARVRRAVLRDLWPDAVDNIASAVRAGLALPEALAQLGDRGPEELREPFRAFADDYRMTGRFSDCLDLLKERLSDPVGDRLVESLRIAREVGGSDLGRLLRTLSGFLREDARTRAELETRQSWTVNAARLATGAPWVVLLVMSGNAGSIGAFSSALGAAVLAGGGVVTAVAYWTMMRIGRLPEDQRVLR